jgi:TRAP-type C4-dicarboxylate transport system substrate-binding protein
VVLSRQATARLLLLTGIAVAFGWAWRQFNTIPLLVMGQPTSVGLLQREQEAPFFEGLAGRTGLPLKITYRPLESLSIKETHQLETLLEGSVDIVSLRIRQNSPKEPTLEGLDLPGTITDFATASRVAMAYGPTVDRHLQRSFRAKLLGTWSLGPQILLCRSPIQHLNDLKGRKVRVASTAMGQLISGLGGIPAILPFDQTKNALAIGLVDCAVTSIASANFAGWTQHTSYYFPLALQFGINGYAIALKRWNQLSPAEQFQLTQAFNSYTESLWRYSEALQRDAESCTIGGTCQRMNRHQLTRIQPSSQDLQQVLEISRRLMKPSWAKQCEQRHPGCSREWDTHVAPIVYPTITPPEEP